MTIFGNRQNIVTADVKAGDINAFTFTIPKEVVFVGNDFDILVRPIDGVCWKKTISVGTDGKFSVNLAAMTKVGTDNNTMKVKIVDNVVSFEYKNGENAAADNDSMIAVVYHRNF